MLLEKPPFSIPVRGAGCRGLSVPPSSPAGAASPSSHGRQLANTSASSSSPNAAVTTHENRFDLPGCAAAMFLAAVWTQAMFYFRPDALFTDLFILHDHGQNLFLVDELSAGHWLYRDVASVYGPLPTLVHWTVARIFGNTAATYLHLWQALTVLGAGLLFGLLRRVASRSLALVWLTVAVFPLFLMPTSARSVLAYTLYPGFERFGALGLALLWRPPTERTRWRTAGLGALLGGMQLIKFGIALPAGVALLATDIFTTRRAQVRQRRLVEKRFWPREVTVLLGGFLVIEAAWVAALFLLLSPARAVELLWPMHMIGSYQSYVTPDLTYLGFFFPWRDLRYFFEQQTPVVVSAILALSVLARWAYRWGRERNVFGLAVVPFRKVASTLPATGDARTFGWALLLAIYFSVAVLTINYPQWVAAQSEWMLPVAALPGAVLLWNTAPKPGRLWRLRLRAAAAVGLVSFLPSALAVISQLQRPPTAADVAAQPMKFSNGETLWITPAGREAFAEVQTELTRNRIAPPKVLALPMASGWHHYFGYGIPAGTRQRWIMAGLVPRAEEADVLRALADADALIFVSRDLVKFPVEPDPGSWRGGHNPGFRPETNAAFRRRLDTPIPIDDRLTVFPVRH